MNKPTFNKLLKQAINLTVAQCDALPSYLSVEVVDAFKTSYMTQGQVLSVIRAHCVGFNGALDNQEIEPLFKALKSFTII